MPARTERGLVAGRLASVGLMPAAALAVHQLRYWLAFGNRAGFELERQGHSYLHSLTPWVILLVAVAVGSFLRALGRVCGGRRTLARYAVSFVALWLLCWACLVAIYMAQEFLEGLVASGHPAGLAGIFGYGGWWAIPAAGGVSLVLAAMFHGARWVLHEIGERRAQGPSGKRRRAAVAHRPPDLSLRRLAPLAHGWSGRGPPR